MRELLDRVAERERVVPNPPVPGDDRDQWRRFAKQLGCGQVQRVKGTNRFHRKRPAHAGEDGVGHGNQVTATLESTERPCRGAFLVGCQPSGDAGAKNGSCGFGDRQGGSDPASAASDRFQRPGSRSSNAATTALDSM